MCGLAPDSVLIQLIEILNKVCQLFSVEQDFDAFSLF